MNVSYLRGQYDEGGANEYDHEELAGPDVGREVAVADGGERDDDVPERVEQVELLTAGALQVLYAAHATSTTAHTAQ